MESISKGIRQDRLQIWAMFMNENPDYDYHYFLNLLKFKLEWMIFYWENFGHLARAEQDISRMRIATRLLDIIMDENSDAPIPYVNMKTNIASVYIINRRVCMKLIVNMKFAFAKHIVCSLGF